MEYIFLNFFSIGAIIPCVFTLLIAAFLLSIPNKTTATLHLGLAFLTMAFFNLGYVVAAAFYHPAAAFHRWLTVGFIFVSLSFFHQFFLHFPYLKRPRLATILLRTSLSIALLITLYFFYATWNSERVFHFAGHYWDFATDDLSRRVGILIFLHVIIIFATGIIRLFRADTQERPAIAIMTISFMIVFVVPGYANILSRDGAIERGTFQTTYDLLNVVGFFVLSVSYINGKKDGSSFMAKIIGISLVTFLLVLQFFSYYFVEGREEAYDQLRRKDVQLSLESPGTPPAGSRTYMRSVKLAPNEYETAGTTNTRADFALTDAVLRQEFLNTAVYEELRRLPDAGFEEGVVKILETTPLGFAAYAASIRAILSDRPGPAALKPRERLLLRLESMSGRLRYARNKVLGMSRLEPDKFRYGLVKLAESYGEGDDLRPFLQVVLHEAATPQEALRFLAPMHKAGTRHYRHDARGEHHVAFMSVDRVKRVVHEIGFDYRSYRRYQHGASLTLVILLMGTLLFLLLGYRLFFKGALLTPLDSLLQGVRRVNEGSLDVSVPVRVEDEIGFLSRSFNGMVESIRGHVAQFSKFVPAQFLTYLERGITDIQLGDAVQKDMTVLFTDIRRFTDISEQMTPEETFRFLNAYLKRMSAPIHHNGGFIDKFIGDAILALFPDPASCLRAAIEMLASLNEYNRERARERKESIRIGIGINAGSLMLGTVGAEDRLDTTVIGDTVNLASRIENMTKRFGVSLLISDSVFRQLPEPELFRMREIDSVRAKGKSRPVVIYEVFEADPPGTRAQKEGSLSTFHEALIYYKAGAFEMARDRFKECLVACPADGTAERYVGRCEHLIKNPPEEWDGVYSMEEKQGLK